VRAFQPSDVSPQSQEFVRRNYLSDPKFTVEEAMKASRVAGPLVQWVQAQCRYADISVRIAPLRDSIDRLTRQCKEHSVVLEGVRVKVREYDAVISCLKADYEVTLQRQASIRAEIAVVERRCNRANTLVSSLRSEQDRWSADFARISGQVENQLGD